MKIEKFRPASNGIKILQTAVTYFISDKQHNYGSFVKVHLLRLYPCRGNFEKRVTKCRNNIVELYTFQVITVLHLIATIARVA